MALNQDTQKKIYANVFATKLASAGIKVTDENVDDYLKLASHCRRIKSASTSKTAAQMDSMAKSAAASLDRILNGDEALETLLAAHGKKDG